MGMDTTEYDKAQILALHRRWWKSNIMFDIANMRPNFPEGADTFLQFNRNGYTYFGREELTTLWELLIEHNYERYSQTTAIIRFEVRADTAWIAADTTATSKDGPTGEIYESSSRSTEIYHRDNGAGVPEWTMWHFHASAHADHESRRPAFDDRLADRGLGANPLGIEPIMTRFGYDETR